MKTRRPVIPFTPLEISRFTAPLLLATLLCMALITLDGAVQEQTETIMVFYGILGFIHTLIFGQLAQKTPNFREKYGQLFAITTGINLGIMFYILPERLDEIFHVMGIIGTLTVATNSSKRHAGITLLLILILSLPTAIKTLAAIPALIDYFTPFIVSVIAMEAYIRLRRTTQNHIHRLETINNVSRQLMQSLDKKQVLALMDSTIRDTLETDSFFIGILSGDNIRLELLCDEGAYFNDVEVPLEGSLTGWVIKNQKELFLPDLREDVQLEGVDLLVIGKEKTSLSWIGVPLKAENITGIMTISSYQPNAFDLADLELLLSLAQHVTLALDNTVRHAQLEEQARLDSLTGVYNHGYFLKKLSEQAEAANTSQSPLSLIMLDIDYFKMYNDTYGHLVGDKILNALCAAIKQHIKHGDTVGRWGGEEFIIALPNATGEQAAQVAKRISETLATLHVEDRDHKTVPVPTISQGIAVFPNEAGEIYQLIDLADKRLYIAKERGRNQIEPDSSHWAKIQIEKKYT